jgi:Ca2+-binding RTX toxin-like protein
MGHIHGGAGSDTILGGTGNDRLYGADHTVDHINGGLGTDHAKADKKDRLTSAMDTPTLPPADPCLA